MTWNNANPVPTEKIKDLSAKITPNWVAIQGGDDNLKQEAINIVDRQSIAPVIPGSDPTALSTVTKLYSKQGSGGNPELFTIDGVGAIFQLTDKQYRLNALIGVTYLGGNVVMQWGQSTLTGGTPVAVIFSIPFAAVYNIQATRINNRGLGLAVKEVSITGFKANSTAAANDGFYWTAIGAM